MKRFCDICEEPIENQPEDGWCEGCCRFICTSCDQRQFLPLEHEPEQHLETHHDPES